MAEWVVKRGEREQAVRDLETLRGYAESGRVRPDDLVRSADGTDWVRVSEMPELSAADPLAQTPPAKPSTGTPRKLIMAIATVVLIALAILVSFWMWTRTPQYAIRQIQTAIQQHDLQKFKKYVDVDGVAADLFALVEANMSDSGNLASAVATTMSGSLQDTLKRTLANMVESQESGAPRIVYDFVGLDSTYSGIEHVRRDGRLAMVGLKFTPARTTEPLVWELRMRDLGSHWQVAGLNVPQILATKRARDASEIVRARKEREETQAAVEKHHATTSNAASTWTPPASLATSAVAPPKPVLLSLTSSTSAIVGGSRRGSVIATLTLADPAFEAVSVAVSADSAIVSVPAFVAIPRGATTTSFAVKTFTVQKPARVSIHAETDGQRRDLSLLVNPPKQYVHKVYEGVYFDPATSEYHVSTCPTAKGRQLTSYRAMIVQRVPRAKDCVHLPAPFRETISVQDWE